MQEENHEEEQITEIEKAKPKKELSQKQKEHLDNIRVKALERKREIKLMKNKQYEEKVSKLKVEQVEIKKEEEKEPPLKEEIKKEETKEETKKKKVIKKVIKYVEADSDEEEQEEIVVKPKKKIESKPEPTIPPKELSYNELLYQTSLEKMQTRIMNERAKQLIHHVIPNYY